MVAAACSSSHLTSTATTGQRPTTTSGSTGGSTAALVPGARYVALGSSFAAGPGIPTQLASSCARSDHNYPHLVAAQLKLQLVDVSCSGATTASILDQSQLGNPPQIEAVTADTALITLTIGGNDIQYTATTLVCEQNPACLNSISKSTIDAAVGALPVRLGQLIAALRIRAPHAMVVLVTYIQVVPPEGAQCAKLRLSADAAAYVAMLGLRLEQTLLAVAKSTGVLLADPYQVTAGHGPCAPQGDNWVAGARAPQGFPYHPTAVGHEEVASLVIAALQHS